MYQQTNQLNILNKMYECMVPTKYRNHPNFSNVCSSEMICLQFFSRHTDDMIHKLESAGLGYHVKTEESDDRLGITK